MIVFIHIPKCAGTSFNSYLKKNFRHSKVLHAGTSNEVKALKARSMKEVERKFSVVGGHIPFPELKKMFPEFSLALLVLRDPVERFFSLYRDISTRDGHPMKETVSSLTVMEFLDYSKKHSVLSKNLHQVWWVSEEISAELAIQAMSESPFWVTVQDRIDRDSSELSSFLNLSYSSIEFKNVHTKRNLPEITNDELSELKDFFCEDFKLIDHVSKMKSSFSIYPRKL